MTQKQLIEELTARGLYEPGDETILKELFTNIRYMRMAKKEIDARGITLNVSRDENKPYYQINHAVSVYNTALGNALKIANRFGLTPSDRAKLKLLNIEDADDYGKEFEGE